VSPLIRISKKTKSKSEEVMEKAVKYFSKELGLKVTDRSRCCAYFEGSGGYVRITITENGESDLEVESREWEYQAKEFLKRVS